MKTIVYQALKTFNGRGLFDFLENNGYFEAPAAKSHHGNHRGGLAEHSITVMQELQNLTDKLGIKWTRPESPAVIGLLHDICKMDEYIFITSEIQGRTFEKIEYNKNQLIEGHGDKSCILAMQYMDLTEEEIMCIRYHMGAFGDKDMQQAYSRAVAKYPGVLYTHTADMIASQILNI